LKQGLEIEPGNAMESGIGFLFLIAIVVLVVLLKMNSRQKEEGARSRAHDEMRPYHQAYANALASADMSIVIKTGNGLLEAARYWQPWDVASVTEGVYKDALNLLKEHPDAKPYALSIGRAAYAARRLDGKLTIYDEQAIMNDISAHS